MFGLDVDQKLPDTRPSSRANEKTQSCYEKIGQLVFRAYKDGNMIRGIMQAFSLFLKVQILLFGDTQDLPITQF